MPSQNSVAANQALAVWLFWLKRQQKVFVLQGQVFESLRLEINDFYLKKSMEEQFFEVSKKTFESWFENKQWL